LTFAHGDIGDTEVFFPWDAAQGNIIRLLAFAVDADGEPWAAFPTTNSLELGVGTTMAATNVTYAWDLSDGTLVTGSLVSHIYPSLRQFSAVVTTTNESSVLTGSTVVTIIKPSGELAIEPWDTIGCAGWYHRYWITYTNVSAIALHHVSLQVENPVNTLVVPQHYSAGIAKLGNGHYAWNLGTVPAGQTIVKRLVVQFFSNIPNETDVTVGVAVTADESNRLTNSAVVEVRRDGVCEGTGPWPTPSPTPSPTATPVGQILVPLVFKQ
jgi:hypothetical protein